MTAGPTQPAPIPKTPVPDIKPDGPSYWKYIATGLAGLAAAGIGYGGYKGYMKYKKNVDWKNQYDENARKIDRDVYKYYTEKFPYATNPNPPRS